MLAKCFENAKSFAPEMTEFRRVMHRHLEPCEKCGAFLMFEKNTDNEKHNGKCFKCNNLGTNNYELFANSMIPIKSNSENYPDYIRNASEIEESLFACYNALMKIYLANCIHVS